MRVARAVARVVGWTLAALVASAAALWLGLLLLEAVARLVARY